MRGGLVFTRHPGINTSQAARMPIDKVVVTGSGGNGGGCLSTLVALTIGLLFLSYACDSLTSPNSGGVAVSEQATSSRSDRASSQSEGAPPSEEEPTASDENQSEPSLREQYINDWALRRVEKEGAPVALVAIAGANSFRTRLAQELRKQGVSAQSGILKATAYESDALFRRLEGGDRQLLRRLGLTQFTGHLVLGRLSVREPKPGELYKAHAHLSVSMVPLTGGQPARREFEERGAGFDQADAREQALKRVRRAFLKSPVSDQLTRP